MRKYIFGIIGLLILVGAGYLLYHFFFSPKEETLLSCNLECSEDGQCQSGHCYDGRCRNLECETSEDCVCPVTGEGEVLVRSNFNEDFRDGEIDEFWKFDNGGIEENYYEVDYVREELVMTAMGQTSQWTNDNSAPLMSFLTDRDFKLIVEFDFDPRQDFQHGGIGLLDEASGDWVRVSRTYDSHSLEDPGDQPNTVYVMQRTSEGVLKFSHDNYRDVRVYLSMEKSGDNVEFEYSRDGREWSMLDDIDLVGYGDELRVYLFAYSTSMSPVEAVFKNIDFVVSD